MWGWLSSSSALIVLPGQILASIVTLWLQRLQVTSYYVSLCHSLHALNVVHALFNQISTHYVRVGNRGAGIPEVWPYPISGGFWLSPVPGDQGRLSQAARLSPLSEL